MAAVDAGCLTVPPTLDRRGPDEFGGPPMRWRLRGGACGAELELVVPRKAARFAETKRPVSAREDKEDEEKGADEEDGNVDEERGLDDCARLDEEVVVVAEPAAERLRFRGGGDRSTFADSSSVRFFQMAQDSAASSWLAASISMLVSKVRHFAMGWEMDLEHTGHSARVFIQSRMQPRQKECPQTRTLARTIRSLQMMQVSSSSSSGSACLGCG
mmetsp:Transcript_14767/g.43769  ORF Transcript_14767/g.43769 Transcript_14767/m.43769 type:complete len:215 (+) Transcript_14767:648-1292(+)